MGSESIAHEAKGQMGYWRKRPGGREDYCFTKIQLVGQEYQYKTTLARQQYT